MEPLQMNEKTAPELPQGWVWTRLGEISKTTSGGTPSRKNGNYFGGSIPWLKSGELNNGIILRAEESITEIGLEKSSAKIIPKGTTLIALYGATVGKLAILGIDAAINQAICAIFQNNFLHQKYLFWHLSSYRNELLNARIGGAQPNISQQIVKDIHFPLPPLPEQHRIVTKIEELFTQLDAGVVALQKTQAQLKQYRQSVLKSACEGKLVPTEAELARAEGREYEPADVLLERILKERRGNWEEEQKRKGKKSAKYKEPAAPDVSDLYELPEGWIGASIEQIADHRLGKMLDKGKNKGEFRPYLRNINVRWFEFDLSDVQYMRVMDEELENVSVHKGDLVICEGGEPGRAAVWNRNEPMIIQKALHRARPAKGILPTYLTYCLKSDADNGRLEKYFTGSTIKHFTGQSLHSYVFLLPPLAEQHRIVAEIERRLSVADAIEKTIAQSLKQAESLRQSILKKAFEGKLLPQNPDDEPASVLLEKIQEEKVKLEIEEKNDKKMKPKKKMVNQMEKDGVDFKNAIGLHEILKSSKISLTPKELWQSSKLDIDDFYAELKTEVERGRIIERRPDDSAVFLEVGE